MERSSGITAGGSGGMRTCMLNAEGLSGTRAACGTFAWLTRAGFTASGFAAAGFSSAAFTSEAAGVRTGTEFDGPTCALGGIGGATTVGGTE